MFGDNTPKCCSILILAPNWKKKSNSCHVYKCLITWVRTILHETLLENVCHWFAISNSCHGYMICRVMWVTLSHMSSQILGTTWSIHYKYPMVLKLRVTWTFVRISTFLGLFNTTLNQYMEFVMWAKVKGGRGSTINYYSTMWCYNKYDNVIKVWAFWKY